ncbi:hypothetical protein SPRG_08510 [Saprolegnia parasitica CBS 223.65]|uniref:Uncharacterized protein n=1 Tax=Saprolegnia parasitica (strain CBS 223.65) TaxID=695850 RepID=A0A067C5W5_SAPPC|nr:hypothetical protein SPRG_08510 [Saprolegnia parasitica CBS 223.65]KDO26149.1 hypothetical protein SPRG_08510 [Saprolegnia parasitica CBS 223.65]|eukprot:XP_012203143.1 hypothetical protein SPRG_08510 [Saprolegnia parasitica CBS 223.65]
MASRVNSALCAKADAILKFWFGATYPATLEVRAGVWFARNPDFDASVAASFGDLVGDLGATSASALLPLLHSNPFAVKVAAVLCLDQFTRNLYRDDKRAFASDDLASTFVLETLARSEAEFLSATSWSKRSSSCRSCTARRRRSMRAPPSSSRSSPRAPRTRSSRACSRSLPSTRSTTRRSLTPTAGTRTATRCLAARARPPRSSTSPTRTLAFSVLRRL